MSNLVWLIILPQATSAHVQEPVVRAEWATAPPTIDGRLDDTCWEVCTPATDFHMVEPNPGAPVTQPTRVYVCYDEENIYFGVHMSEDEPDRMQAACNQRDGTVYLDDSFEIILDTYCDRRNAYYFMSNLLGTELDGRIIDEGRNVDQTWDGHWDARSQLVEDGWEMEIGIPFSELSFPQADSLVWGVNFWRIERPHWESTSWAPVQKWNQISKYGTLTGISIKPRIKRFEFLPYAATCAVHREDDFLSRDSLAPKAGIDFEYDVTPNLIVSATLWPDFAQIEADPLQFNLSYQEGEELYFPEKRPFFLEGGAILRTPLQLFYTRRMKEIMAGVKLYGKIESTELLALNVQTQDTEENFSVLRLKRELFGTATSGILATHKQHSDSVSQAVGIDLNLPVYGPFLFTSQVAATRNTGVSSDISRQWAGHVGIEGETGDYGAGLFAGRMGSDFQVHQGFIDTLNWNIQGLEGHAWNKFLQNRGWFQWINGHGSFDVRQEIGGRPTHAETELGIDFITRPKWRFSIGGSRGYERYGEQEFVNRALELQIESNVGGMTGVSSSYTTGTLYDLPLRFFHFGFLILPIRRASVFPYFQGFRWGENSWEWLSNARISYQVTDKAFVRIFLRAESEFRTPTDRPFALEEIENLDGNLLFGYEFSPGTILYMVYNQQQTFTTEETDHIFVAKFSYSLQF